MRWHIIINTFTARWRDKIFQNPTKNSYHSREITGACTSMDTEKNRHQCKGRILFHLHETEHQLMFQRHWLTHFEVLLIHIDVFSHSCVQSVKDFKWTKSGNQRKLLCGTNVVEKCTRSSLSKFVFELYFCLGTFIIVLLILIILITILYIELIKAEMITQVILINWTN